MDTKQAKDFLVREVAEQAALENVPLDDLEKRMMYFTESDPTSCETPVELNTEFEGKYDTEQYEHKISRLLRNAYKRLKDEDPEKLRGWDQAVRALRKGDHYLLVLLDRKPKLSQQGRGVWVAIAWGFGLGIALVILMMVGIILDHEGLFPRRPFAWIGAVFDSTDDPFLRRLRFDLIAILLLGGWFVFRLAKRGILRQLLRAMWNDATLSAHSKKNPPNS